MAGLDSTGFTAKPLADIETEIKTEVLGAISPTLNLSATSVIGQVIGATASQVRQVWEAGADNYAAADKDQASGDALTALCKLTGTVRKAATASTVLMTITLAAGTYNAGTLVVHVVGDPTSRFTNDSTIVTLGATLTGQAFTSDQLGPVRANAGTLTVIATPVTGFSAPTNPAEAVLGLEIESDAELRIRHDEELARTGSSTVDAIRVDVADSDATAITFVAVYENDTDATVDTIPPHSFETLVQGGTTADIAAAIFAAKPAGIRAYGTTTSAVIDTQGSSHTIGFTRPTVRTIYIDLALTVISGTYAGDTAVKEAITDWCDDNLSVGRDVIQTRIEALALGVAGVVDAVAEIGLSAGAGTAAANFVIANREIASVDQGNIAIVQTVVTGAP